MKTLRMMMLMALLGLVVFSGCDKGVFCERGKGDTVTMDLDIAEMDGFEMEIAADVTLRKGTEQKVTVTGQQNLIDLIRTDVKNGVWHIDTRRCIGGKTNLSIDITLPDFDYVGLSGSGTVIGEDHFDGLGDVDVRLTGSGEIALSLDASQLSSTITGSGDIDIAGTAARHELEITGSGNIRGFDMIADKADVEISGSGNAELTAITSLDVSITGSGNVYYKGDPTVNVSITGSGQLIHED